MSNQPNTKYPPHPGKIIVVDAATQQIINEASAAEYPPTMAYADNEEGVAVPVVRMEVHYKGDQRIIRKYGPHDEYLGAVVQIAD